MASMQSSSGRLMLRSKYVGLKEARAEPTLTYSELRERYEFRTSYAGRLLPKKFRLMWDPVQKIWHTDSPKIAVKLIHFADDATRARLLHRFS